MTNQIPFCQSRLFACLTLALALNYGPPAAANDVCTVANGITTCEGDQSSGINQTAPPSTLNVINLSGPIQPAAGSTGVQLRSSSGLDVTINSGNSQAKAIVTTSQAPGIVGSSTGTPSASQQDTFLGIPIPGSPGTPGGAVQVNSRSDITTSGASSPGIAAQSANTGYPAGVITALRSFNANNIHFVVTAVQKPDGSAGTVSSPVAGQVMALDADGKHLVPSAGQLAGSITINEDGSFSVDTSTGFADLTVDQSRIVAVNYSLEGTNGANTKSEAGQLFAKVTMTDTGLVIEQQGAIFPDYGEVDLSSGGQALPDLQSYVNSLIAIAQTGGAGNSVTVSHQGTITTTGVASNGISAQSTGGQGTSGTDGGGFWSFGTRPPSGGSSGNAGGTVTVAAFGTITTSGQGSIGVFAQSGGGNGGNGGSGGLYYSGRPGGDGGNGGLVLVFGSGGITTVGDGATGILASSDAGNGGNGGSGKFVNGAGNGGAGGAGGEVDVIGSWTINTSGNSASDISAASTGGNGGSGGTVNGIGATGNAGGGGTGGEGGKVDVESGANISASGNSALGISASSTGGNGGSGGGLNGIGGAGNGGEGGTGGIVAVTNNGIIATNGSGIWARSTGGNGGNGGHNYGIGSAGHAGAGNAGGSITVTSAGSITTTENLADAIWAASSGGAGGAGGDTDGIGAGGSASAGGAGGSVTVTSGAAINTGRLDSSGLAVSGDRSDGINVRTTGGNGGSGGHAYGAGAAGDAGAGGAGGGVTVTSTAPITTRGYEANAIWAASAGGAGGAGGNTDGIGAGGNGSTGGAGGSVTVTSSAAINTGLLGSSGLDVSGDYSDGIYARSTGGNGGSGGHAYGAGAAGNAGAGAAGGRVTVTSTNRITTPGSDSKAIWAASAGGAGGAGGDTDGVGAGGNGSAGGAGGSVTVTSSAAINTGLLGSSGLAVSGAGSSGIHAQSTGGNGGVGGHTYGIGAAGDGDGGGVGGAVTVTSTDSITTRGYEAEAIWAASYGGAGGAGGNTDGAGGSGAGAAGGRGGTVSVTINDSASITTSGDASDGILARSIGGIGGNGGNAYGVAVAERGATGGKGGDVDVLIDGTGSITTNGADSNGISAASTGGTGGKGGDIYGITVAGYGVGGGNGGNVGVTIKSEASVTANGNASSAILAQSTGGNGGDGGRAYGFAAFAGYGGSGGIGGEVHVENWGSIATNGLGMNSYGILATSTGGNGGNGGNNYGFIGRGDDGGNGGNAGAVTVTNEGSLSANGIGIRATSTGGNGGNGGSMGQSDAPSELATDAAIDALIGGSEVASEAIGIILGVVNTVVSRPGDGGGGGNGGGVTVINHGTLSANGIGIQVSSAGGTGGNGGLVGSLDLVGFVAQFVNTLTTDFAGWSFLEVNGAGGAGGNGGEVQVTNTGAITTTGNGSDGIQAKGAGGNGGNGGNGYVIGDGGEGGEGGEGGAVSVTVTSTGSVTTSGSASHGIYAQSTGGAGGAGGTAYGTGATGRGGIGGNGGEVSVTTDNFGSITTKGNTSDGIWAKSSGGNGGNGGTGYGISALASEGVGGDGGDGGTVTLSINGAINTGLVDSAGLLVSGNGSDGVFAQSAGGKGGDGGATYGVSLAGDAGRGGDGGSVTVTTTSSITTKGSAARGIAILSTGGAGGAGGDTYGVGRAGDGGDGGNGGDVAVTNGAAISTAGIASHGIYAASTGGNGGIGGNAYVTGRAGDGGNGGDGGNIAVTNNADITASGNQSDGILAQSKAGGGGTGGTWSLISGSPGTGGSGGPVSVTSTGNIIANGLNSVGIFAQSSGDAGAGKITIHIDDGSVSGGSGSGAGVAFVGGNRNELTNHGTISALSGTAVTATTGGVTIDNFGTLTGSVRLGAGTNPFHNEQAAIFNSGAVVDLGTGNLLTNEGRLSPGGSTAVQTSRVTGNLVQSGSGVYVVNVDHASISTDRVDVSGTTQLAGKAQVVDLNGGYVTPGAHQMTILTSAGGITDAGLTLETGSSAMVAYQLVHPDSTQLALAYQVDFAPTGLNGNEAALSDYLARAQLAGGSTGLAPVVTALFSQPDVRSLAAAYERLSPEPYLAIGTGTLFANLAFSDRLHSCGVRDGPDRFIREGECDWLQATSGELRRSRTDANLGSTHKSSGVAAGVQRAIGDGSWHLGLGLAYEHSTDAVDDLANTSGDSGQLGVVLKKSLGATSLAVDLTAGYGSYTTDRHVNLPLPGLTAKSSQEARFVAAHFRVAHAYEQPGNWYVKPSVDFGLAHAWFPGFEESGAAGADLHVQSHQEHHAMLTPAVEIGGETVLDGGQLLRPYARFGITRFLAGTSATIMTSFRDAPPGVAPFTVRSDLDNTFANLDLGVSIVGTKGTIVRIGYVGKFSQHVISNGAMAKLMIPF